MRVVVASKFWYPRGGLERVMFGDIAGLEAAGHEVAHYSTRHPENVPSPWAPFFAPYLELGTGGGLGPADEVRAAARMFVNKPAARAFGRLLDDFRPRVVHVHGIHRQLSPSILFEAKKRGVPVVQTLHDAHHVCPADVLLRGGREVCSPRRCGELNYLAAVSQRCVRGSLPASALSAAETAWQRARRVYERTVSRFTAPSGYLVSVMRDGGWRLPIDLVPNGVAVSGTAARIDEGFFLVAGRLSAEKRVDLALSAARAASAPVVVAGDGPCRGELERLFPEADFVGHLPSEGVGELLRRCRAVVVSSAVPENAPMSVLEAMAHGKPVIAPALGGVPELVRDGQDGLVVPPADVLALAGAVATLRKDPVLAARLGETARVRARQEFSLERHMELLLEVYHRAIGPQEGPA